MPIEAKRIINGSNGEVWIDDDKVMEAYALDAKVEIKWEEIALCGQPGVDRKMVGFTGKGTLKVRKVYSRMGKKIGENIRKGIDVRAQIISKLKDNDNPGTERVLLKGVAFDDLTLANWEVQKPGDVDIPFTFVDFEYLDSIDPQ